MKVFEILGKFALNSSEAIGEIDKVDKKAGKFTEKISKMAAKVGKFGMIAGTAIAGTITGTIAAGIKATADLDEQMSKFKASTGATVQDTEEIRRLAQDLYKTNTDSMEDIIATAAELRKSMGLTTDEIKKYQQVYMDYAKTTGQANTDVVQAIDDISDAWGLTAEESAKSLDMLKKSNEEYGTDLVAVQKALAGVAPAAKALGLSFEEANGIMNLFASSGLDAGQAVTAFTYAAKKVKSPKEFRKMLDDIQKIKDPTERAQKAVELFGARAGVAMANVLDGTKNLQDFITTMDSAAGTVAKASAEFDNNLNVQIELAKKQFTGLVQELGEKFMPAINEILKWVTAKMPVIVSIIERAISFVGDLLHPFASAIKETLQSIDLTPLIDALLNFKDVIFSLFEPLLDLIFRIGEEGEKTFGEKLGAAIQMLIEGLSFLVEKISYIITEIKEFVGGLVSAIMEALQYIDLTGLIDALLNFKDVIFSLFEPLLDLIFRIGEESQKTFGKKLGMAIQMLVEGLTFLVETLSFIITEIKEFVETSVSLFMDFYNRNKETFDTVFASIQEIFNLIKEFFITWFEVVKEKMQAFWEFIRIIWDKYGTEIKAIIENVWNGIKIIIETALNLIKDIIKIATNLLRGDWEAVWNGIKDFVVHLWEGLVKMFSNWWDFIKNIFSSSLQMIWDVIKSVFQNIVNSIQEKMTETKDKIINTFTSIINWFKDKWSSITSILTAPFEKLGGKLKELKDGVGGLLDKGGGMVKGLLGANAEGTNYFRGGQTLVGEKGPEILTLPSGSAITPVNKFNKNNDSNNVTQATLSVNNSFNISQLVVREEADIKKIAKELYRLQVDRNRKLGIATY